MLTNHLCLGRVANGLRLYLRLPSVTVQTCQGVTFTFTSLGKVKILLDYMHQSHKKLKFALEQAMKVYFYSFFNPRSRWGGWSTPGPVGFTPRKETLRPLYVRLYGPQGQSGRVRKIWPPPWFDSRTIQPVASRCTDYTKVLHVTKKKHSETKFQPNWSVNWEVQHREDGGAKHLDRLDAPFVWHSLCLKNA